MNAEERERFRWQFSGQAMQSIFNRVSESFLEHKESSDRVFKAAVDIANELIVELEKTAPKEPEKPVGCEHTWFNYSGQSDCPKCGATR